MLGGGEEIASLVSYPTSFEPLVAFKKEKKPTQMCELPFLAEEEGFEPSLELSPH